MMRVWLPWHEGGEKNTAEAFHLQVRELGRPNKHPMRKVLHGDYANPHWMALRNGKMTKIKVLFCFVSIKRSFLLPDKWTLKQRKRNSKIRRERRVLALG